MKIFLKTNDSDNTDYIDIINTSEINSRTDLSLRVVIVISVVIVLSVNTLIVRWDLYVSVISKQNVSNYEFRDFFFLVFSSWLNTYKIVWVSQNIKLEITKLYCRNLFSLKWTFVNFLILIDCGNALLHIPVILQYFWWDDLQNIHLDVNMMIVRRVIDDDLICIAEFGLNRLMVVMNRSIPVAIAIYRYAHVFFYDRMYDKRTKKVLEIILSAYIAGKWRVHLIFL